MKVLKYLSYIFISVFSWQSLYSQVTGGFLDFNAYRDSRGFNELTINALAKWENKWQYFSLTNFTGSSGSDDLNTFYTEQNIRKTFGESDIQFTNQNVFKSGVSNDAYRLGLRWIFSNLELFGSLKKRCQFFASINPFFVEYDELKGVGSTRVIEYVYRISDKENKLVFSGFADQLHQLTDSLKFNWVSEHQLAIRLLKAFYAVAEYRINTFKNKPHGLGLGLEYKVMF